MSRKGAANFPPAIFDFFVSGSGSGGPPSQEWSRFSHWSFGAPGLV